MPRKIRPRPCGCGCEATTKGGEFLPGHDSKLYAAIIEEVGGVMELRRIVEKSLGHTISVNLS